MLIEQDKSSAGKYLYLALPRRICKRKKYRDSRLDEESSRQTLENSQKERILFICMSLLLRYDPMRRVFVFPLPYMVSPGNYYSVCFPTCRSVRKQSNFDKREGKNTPKVPLTGQSR
jgi:hypothetical protein